MKRREFLAATTAAAIGGGAIVWLMSDSEGDPKIPAEKVIYDVRKRIGDLDQELRKEGITEDEIIEINHETAVILYAAHQLLHEGEVNMKLLEFNDLRDDYFRVISQLEPAVSPLLHELRDGYQQETDTLTPKVRAMRIEAKVVHDRTSIMMEDRVRNDAEGMNEEKLKRFLEWFKEQKEKQQKVNPAGGNFM